MAPKDLTTEEMLGLSGAWTHDKETRAALKAHPRTSGILDDIVAAHDGLIATQASPAARSAEATRLLEESLAVDQTHDRKARGVNLVLAGLIELVDDEDARQSFIAARDVLHPDGLSFVNLNYAAEAGNVELVRHRMAERPEVAKTLARIKLVEKKTLADESEAWLVAGERLGQIEAERHKLVQPDEQAKGGQAQAVKARNRWIRVVNALVSHIQLDEPPDTELARLVLTPLQKALTRAEGRAKREGGAAGGQGGEPDHGGGGS